MLSKIKAASDPHVDGSMLLRSNKFFELLSKSLKELKSLVFERVKLV